MYIDIAKSLKGQHASRKMMLPPYSQLQYLTACNRWGKRRGKSATLLTPASS